MANAGVSGPDGATWELDPADWWHVQEINVLGVHLCCRAVIPGMLERGSGRIVITGERRRVPARLEQHRLPDEQGGGLPLRRDAGERAARADPGLLLQPGPREDGDDGPAGADDLPWTPPELAPQLVHVLASGRADALAGRYIHAEHDDIEDLIARADEIEANDLNAIRLQR